MLYAKHLDSEKQRRLRDAGVPVTIYNIVYDSDTNVMVLEVPFVPNSEEEINKIVGSVKKVFGDQIAEVKLVSYNAHRWIYGVVKDGKYTPVSRFAAHRMRYKEPIANNYKLVQLSELDKVSDSDIVEIIGVAHNVAVDQFGNIVALITDGMNVVKGKVVGNRK